ncbi:hypothetical protein HFP43_20195 [Streptomyces sp. SJ1-7]|nr:hypothetical protein [Streptomyces sp. SJ1-7]
MTRPLFPGLSRPLLGRLRPAHAGSRAAALLAGLAGAGHRAAPAASDQEEELGDRLDASSG